MPLLRASHRARVPFSPPPRALRPPPPPSPHPAPPPLRRPPVWPAAWAISFSEETFGPTTNTSGTWYYDFSAGVQRIDRGSGKNDRYCGSVDPADAPCSHLVVAGERYLVWPTLKKCCGCCNSTAGCGIVKPTWMVDANGTFSGTAPFTDSPYFSGVADSWQINGLQPNFWFTETGTDTPVGFAQVPDDYQWFNPASYVVGPQDPSLFTIPSFCTPTCPGINICTLI